MENEVDCKCKEWRSSADQIFTAQVQYTLRTGVKYTGARFKYCPWCGCSLTLLKLHRRKYRKPGVQKTASSKRRNHV